MRFLTKSLVVAAALAVVPMAQAFEPPQDVECVAPAAPGGGWDFTCRSVGRILSENGLVDGSVTTTNMPGAGGGVAYSYVVGKRGDDPNLIVAASTATTSRLAQDMFAGLDADQVRWVASLGADFGVIAVSPESEYDNLKELMSAVKAHPNEVSFAGASAVGGWDHLKVLMLAKEAGMDNVRQVKYISFNSGGNALTQLLGGHVDAFTGDLSEITGMVGTDKIDVLAVLADKRLPDRFSQLPTAREQGFDVVAPNWRGFYMPLNVSDAAYQWWVDTMHTLYQSDAWKQAMSRNGLVPFWKGGEELQAFVADQINSIRQLSRELGLIK